MESMKTVELWLTLIHRVLTGYRVVVDKEKRTTTIHVEVK